MHANNGRRLHPGWAIDVFQMNHGVPAMRVAFRAGLHASLATDASGLIDKEVVLVCNILAHALDVWFFSGIVLAAERGRGRWIESNWR